MQTYTYTLPQGSLLTLCSDDDINGPQLTSALRQALQHGNHHIWVDCRHLATLSPGLLQRLQWYAARLWAAGSYLLLCHLSAPARAALTSYHALPLAATPLDADLYGLDCPELVAAS